MSEFVLRTLMSFLPGILEKLTPNIRDMLENFLREWYVKALETPNPYDDLVCKLLGSIIGIDVTQPKAT